MEQFEVNGSVGLTQTYIPLKKILSAVSGWLSVMFIIF